MSLNHDHDLLTRPLLSWRDAQQRRAKSSLPGILARLASGELWDFPRVRAHQLHPWCMFLTQLAAIALRRAGETDPRLSEEAWRTRLLALTRGAHEPWCLVVEDLAKPAFLQPPVPEGDIASWKGRHERPDELDILVTSKGHDVKVGLISPGDLEAWVYALVLLQTMQGYPGRGYYGIARMKGGYGNRPRVGLAVDASLAARFGRDVHVLLESWTLLLERGYNDAGLALVWTVPWDGATSLAMATLTPHFIEVCGRVRCTQIAGGLACAYTTIKARRCLPEIENGDVGDPWVPIEVDEGALTIGGGGFHYGLLSRLLFEGDFAPAAAQRLQPSDPDPVVMMFWALARGQGKTEGLHERALVLAGSVRRLLGQPDGRSLLGRRSNRGVQEAEKMRSKVLFPALKRIALGAKPPKHRFDARVDEVFFEELFAGLEADEDVARLAWERTLRDIAWDELRSAIERCSVADARRYRAISEAESLFRSCLRKQFPDLVAGDERDAKGVEP